MNDYKLIEAIKGGALRRDKIGRAWYMVPTSVRRNCQMIVPLKTIQRLLKKGEITQDHIDNIRSY